MELKLSEILQIFSIPREPSRNMLSENYLPVHIRLYQK